MAAIPATVSRSDICKIQRALNATTKAQLVVDGDFGPKSIEALRLLETKLSMPVTGVYAGAIKVVLDNLIRAKYLNQTDFARAAKALGCEVAAIEAVVEVESSGSGFFNDGSCAILFERHKFYQALVKRLPAAQVQRLAYTDANIVCPISGGYIGQEGEHLRLNRAIAIHSSAALESASWGLFQIMGFNFAACGYSTVEAYVEAMKTSEGLQLDAFVNFIKNDATLLNAIRTKNWSAFAKKYNGPNYAANGYHTKLAAKYKLAKAA